MSINKNLSIIGVPMDTGAGRAGTRLGPDSIRLAGVVDRLEALDCDIVDLGNICVDNIPTNSPYEKKLIVTNDACNRLYNICNEIIKEGRFPLILGGDHTLVLGSGKAVIENYSNPGIIYIDAHGDINTDESSITGNIHGMPVAALMGMGDERLKNLGNSKYYDFKNIVYIGLRDLDPFEKELIKEKGIVAYTMADIDKLGMETVVQKSIDHITSVADHIHLSFDIDAIDPKYAPGTGIRVDGGITYREARLALEMISELDNIVSMDIVEVSPPRDIDDMTAKLAVDLLSVVFGERLL